MGYNKLTAAVNISAKQFNQDNIVEVINGLRTDAK